MEVTKDVYSQKIVVFLNYHNVLATVSAYTLENNANKIKNIIN